MEKSIIKVSDQDQIEAILTAFQNDLKSLQRGVSFRHNMAEKFAKFGNVICLEYNDVVEAFAAFYCNDCARKVAYLSMIAVKKNCRGLGYGNLILKNVEDYSLKMKMHSIMLEVDKKNSNAIHFYRNNMYEMIEEREKTFIYEKLI